MTTVYVVDDEKTHTSGYPHPLVTPPNVVNNLPFILGKAADWNHREVTIILPRLPAEDRAQVRTIAELLDWSTNDTDGGWWTLRDKQTRNIVHLGVLDCGALEQFAVAAQPIDGEHLCDLLTHWRLSTGAHYRHTPGVAAVASMLAQDRAKRPRWTLQDHATADWWKPPYNVVDHKRVTKSKPGEGFHRWDMRSAYLAAMGQVEIPYRQLIHTGHMPTTMDCGYYRITSRPMTRGWHAWLWPAADRQSCRWLTAPELQLWRRLSIPYELVDSWTPGPGPSGDDTGHGRILRPWVDMWQGAMRNTHPDLVGTMKAGYAQAVGLMNVKRGSIYRPDWRGFIIGHVRASIARRVYAVHEKLGYWPNRVNVDAIYYPGDANRQWDIAQEIGEGPNIGNMRYEGWGQW